MAGRHFAGKTLSKRKIPSSVVHCICIVSSFQVVACALLTLGTTCHIIGQDRHAGPCPANLPAIVFGIAGGLALSSVVLIIKICRTNRKSKNERLNNVEPKIGERLAGSSQFTSEDVNRMQSVVDGTGNGPVEENDCKSVEVDNFAMTQKSADVSHWIEQQKPSSEECCAMETTDGATKPDAESVHSETTNL